VLRLLEKFSLEQLTEAIEYALDVAEAVRTIVEHRTDRPVAFFSLDGRPHLHVVRVETSRRAVCHDLLDFCARVLAILADQSRQLPSARLLDRWGWS